MNYYVKGTPVIVLPMPRETFKEEFSLIEDSLFAKTNQKTSLLNLSIF